MFVRVTQYAGSLRPSLQPPSSRTESSSFRSPITGTSNTYNEPHWIWLTERGPRRRTRSWSSFLTCWRSCSPNGWAGRVRRRGSERTCREYVRSFDPMIPRTVSCGRPVSATPRSVICGSRLAGSRSNTRTCTRPEIQGACVEIVYTFYQEGPRTECG